MNDIFTLNFNNYDNSLSNKNEIIETNEKSIEFGLKLSEKEKQENAEYIAGNWDIDFEEEEGK